MQDKLFRKVLVLTIIVLFVGASVAPSISGTISKMSDLEVDKRISNEGIPSSETSSSLSFHTFDKTGEKQHNVVLATDAANDIYNMLEELKYKIVYEPRTDETKALKIEFVDMLDVYGLLPKGLSKNYVLSLLNPSWLNNRQKTPNIRPRVPFLRILVSRIIRNIIDLRQIFKNRFDKTTPKIFDKNALAHLLFADSATATFCSIGSGGQGVTIPLFLLPRPRAAAAWSSSFAVTIVGGLLSGEGFLASGGQEGILLGFVGMGLTFAFPGFHMYGFVGYALYTKVDAEYIERIKPLNQEPVISNENPSDGAVDVPVALSELSFRISDADGDLMDYTVITDPDIGTGSGSDKKSGVYHVPVSGLKGDTDYSWYVTVDDDYDTVEKHFTFTTEKVAPVVSDPFPSDGAQEVPVGLTELSFKLKDYQGDLMDVSVETSPDIGSFSANDVGDGTYTVDIGGLDYFTWYEWYVNVTDGTYWTREVFDFQTEIIMVFDPFDEGWQYRKKITINHNMVDGNLFDFPVLVSTTDSDLRDKAQGDGDDVLFMDGSGVANRLFHEVEYFDGSSGELVAWVNVSSLSSSVDTVLYMYYGNSGCSSQQFPEKVWDSDYKLVYHLDETSGHHQDSTANNADSTAESVTVQGSAAGKIGGADEFERDNTDYVAAPNVGSLNTFALEMWAKYESYVKYEELMGKEKYIGFVTGADDHRLVYIVGDGAWGNRVNSSAGAIETGIWYYIVGTSDGTNIELFIDSDSKGTAENACNFNADFHLGERYANTYSFDGIIDEVRVSATERSQDWITTSYNTMNDPSSFLSFGPEESGP